MAIQLSDAVRNARAAAFEATIGAAPRLQLRTGAQPANCAAAAIGTLLAEIILPSDWLTAPLAGSVSLSGTASIPAVATGTIAHYRVVDAGGVCHEQGSVTLTGGGGDMTADAVVIASIGQVVTLIGYTRIDGNA
jgi:hypothetical protein